MTKALSGEPISQKSVETSTETGWSAGLRSRGLGVRLTSGAPKVRLPVPVLPKRKGHPKKLTWEQVHRIRLSRARGVRPIVLAATYGVSANAIWRICTGKDWRDGTDAVSRGANPYILTQETARQLRADRARGMTLAALGKRYGVSEACASRVCLGKFWKDGSEELSKGVSCMPRKLTWDTVHEIRALRKGGMYLRLIAEKFGVSESLVARVCQGYAWKEDGWTNPFPPGHQRKLSPQKLLRLRELWMVNTPRKQMAKELGVSLGAITHVLTGRTWRKEWENER